MTDASDKEALLPPLSILVVDDEPANRQLLEAILTRAGHRLAVAASGQEALTLAGGAQPFDLALMDLGLPDLDGFETTKRLLAIAPQTRVFALTADDEPHLRRAGAEAGMAAFLTKPISPGELLSIIADEFCCAAAQDERA